MTVISETVRAAYQQIAGVEDLSQMFANRKVQRLGGLLSDIALSTVADAMGPGGRAVAAKYAGWSPQWINRLALIAEMDLPDHLLDPELPVGVYYAILTSDIARAEMFDLIGRAISEEWSVADAKRALGREATSTGGAVIRGEIAEHTGERAVVKSEELGAVQLEPGARVSVRVLK